MHEMLTSVKDLVPYLDEPWRGRVAVDDGFKGPPGNPYAFPQAAGVAIQDAVTDDGGPAGSKLELLQEQVLDRYGIEPAVLISLFHPTDHQIQPEFAVALAGAYNDWVLENWLEREERLRSSITVAAQEPLVLLMDEPFNGLDAQTRNRLHAELNEIVERTHLTVVFATRSLQEALLLGDRVVVLGRAPSRVTDVVEVSSVTDPDSEKFAWSRRQLRKLLDVDAHERRGH